jgi:hypothetical protein
LSKTVPGETIAWPINRTVAFWFFFFFSAQAFDCIFLSIPCIVVRRIVGAGVLPVVSAQTSAS